MIELRQFSTSSLYLYDTESKRYSTRCGYGLKHLMVCLESGAYIWHDKTFTEEYEILLITNDLLGIKEEFPEEFI